MDPLISICYEESVCVVDKVDPFQKKISGARTARLLVWVVQKETFVSDWARNVAEVSVVVCKGLDSSALPNLKCQFLKQGCEWLK